MLSHIVALCLGLLSFGQCIQIHEHMTEEEVSKIFQTGHDNVPEYEVVQLYHTLHKRQISDDSTRMVKLNTLNRNFSLYLKPTEGLLVGEQTPVWTAVEHVGWPSRTKYFRHRKVLANIGKAYHDVSKRSAIVAYEGEDGETLIHGILSEDLIVRPLPYRLHNTILRERRDLVDLLPDGVDGNADFRRSHHHVVFKRPERDMNATHDDIRVVERERRVSRQSSTDDPSKESIPDIIYPEILIIVDFHLYKAIGGSVEEAARYVLAFWNGVDLRYRLLEKPVIRLNIAGIIISLETRGTPYLENARRLSTKIDAGKSIEAMGRYLYSESYRFPFHTYDFAMAMTSLDMYVFSNGSIVRPTAGVAYDAGACMRNPLEMTTTAVAVLQDDGSFIGVWTASNGVADLMQNRNGIENSKDGPAKDKQRNPFHLRDLILSSERSPYNLTQLYAFLSAPESICLRNEPRGGKALPRKLPGEVMTANEQCERKVGTRAVRIDERICRSLACWQPGSTTFAYSFAGAAEGTPCGDEKYCINGYCVRKNPEHVPTADAP